MSEVQKYVAIGGMMPVDSGYGLGVFVQSNDYDAALSQIAALREELASAVKDRETLLRLHVHLRARRSYWITEEGKAQQRLADAERRNADLCDLLDEAQVLAGHSFSTAFTAEIDAALNPNPESDKEIWNDMVDLPAHKAGAKYRMILDDVQQDCVELEMEGRKRWFYGEENGAFPEDEIQAWLPINPNPEAASHDE